MVGITTNAGVESQKWALLATGKATGEATLRAMRRIGIQLQNYIKEKASNADLNVRTGRLRRAVFYRIEQSPGEVVVRAGVDLSKALYGRILDQGGVITPKKAKFLTIPVGPNLTGNGVMRVNAREFISNPGSIGFAGSFVNRQKTAILGVRENGTIEPVFALATSVTIRPTGFVTKSLDSNKAMIMEELRAVGNSVLQQLEK